MSQLIKILIPFFLSLLLILFLIWPKYQAFQDHQVKIEERSNELQNLEEYFSYLQEISEEREKCEAEMSKIDSALPTDPCIPSILHFIERISAENGLNFKKISSFSIISPQVSGATSRVSSQEPELPSGIKKIQLGFEVSGNYFALENFLEDLEKNARIFEVNQTSFSTEEEGVFSFDIQLETYSY